MDRKLPNQSPPHYEIRGIPAVKSDTTTRLLRVCVLRAFGFNKNFTGASNIYCKIALFQNDHDDSKVCPTVRTETVKRQPDAVWDEEFIFRVTPSENRLIFRLCVKNRLLSDVCLGDVPISLPRLNIRSEDPGSIIPPKYFPVHRKSSETRVRGIVCLYLAYLRSGNSPPTDPHILYRTLEAQPEADKTDVSGPIMSETSEISPTASLNEETPDMPVSTARIPATASGTTEIYSTTSIDSQLVPSDTITLDREVSNTSSIHQPDDSTNEREEGVVHALVEYGEQDTPVQCNAHLVDQSRALMTSASHEARTPSPTSTIGELEPQNHQTTTTTDEYTSEEESLTDEDVPFVPVSPVLNSLVSSDEESLRSGWMPTAENSSPLSNPVGITASRDDTQKDRSILQQHADRHEFVDLGPLPLGWEECLDSDGRIRGYTNHDTQRTQWEDPRLRMLVKSSSAYPPEFRKKYDRFRLQLPKLRISYEQCHIVVHRSSVLWDSFRYIHYLDVPLLLLQGLEVRFLGERGVDGGGLTREWFSLLSQQILNPVYGLFKYANCDSCALEINPHSGVANYTHLEYFNFFGKVVGMAVYHDNHIDGSVIRPFFKMILHERITLEDVKSFDVAYYNSLKYIMVNDPTPLDLTFSVIEETFGQSVEVDLITDGRNTSVTEVNKEEYIELLLNWRFVSRVKRQMSAFFDGLNVIFNWDLLQMLDASELELLICGMQGVNIPNWRANTRYCRGYHDGHPVVVNFWKAVYTFTSELRIRLMQFITGTSRVPINRYNQLQCRFDIVCHGSVNELPEVSTCSHELYLPPYDTFEKLRTKLIIAVENTEGFGLC